MPDPIVGFGCNLSVLPDYASSGSDHFVAALLIGRQWSLSPLCDSRSPKQQSPDSLPVTCAPVALYTTGHRQSHAPNCGTGAGGVPRQRLNVTFLTMAVVV